MNPIQESKQELEASIRYAENAIDKAKQTIEQVGAYQQQTGREEALAKRVQELEDKVQGQYDDIKMLEAENAKFRKEKEASSAPCGCQAYRDLEERATMPVIPKDVAIAIFREGVAHGVSNACDELDNSDDIEINETEYAGDFEVSFSKYIDLSEHLDLDWMRSKVGDYDEASVVKALKGLCADKEFKCRIHEIDVNE